ncbi:MAG TPA: glutathione S-transferase family protein, partial [Bdellovibrionota bacterium]|nr:glutathione S-transferase family protein [Bdellovibrionota bacterium]
SPGDQGKAENMIHDALAFLRAMRNTSGGDYLLGEFSYADISMCSVVQVIAPYQNAYMKSHPAVSRLWTDEKLKTEFRDLVEWRDRIYEKHRGP